MARPIFFNDYEIDGKFPSEDFDVFTKLDESLIIMSFFEGEMIFSIRGSFTSEQELKATEIFNRKYFHFQTDLKYTNCYEIIHPKNKTVVNDGQEDDWFLFANHNTKTGEEMLD